MKLPAELEPIVTRLRDALTEHSDADARREEARGDRADDWPDDYEDWEDAVLRIADEYHGAVGLLLQVLDNTPDEPQRVSMSSEREYGLMLALDADVVSVSTEPADPAELLQYVPTGLLVTRELMWTDWVVYVDEEADA